MIRKPQFWISLLSLVAVLYFFADDLGRTAPGPLASVHAQVGSLTGMGSCRHCHGGWFGDMTSSCLDCHELQATQIQNHEGLHGHLAEEKAMHCALCHSEHHGEDFPMVNRQSFVQAGFDGREGFDHAAIGYPMAGKHLEQDCSGCHVNADVALLPEGQLRYAGLSKDCSTCHEDAHEGRMKLACASCHSQVAWDQPASLGHEQWLPLEGGHARTACKECHGEGTPHALEALGRGAQPARRQCGDCHDSPHAERFIDGIGELLSWPRKATCGACHLPAHDRFRVEGLTVTPEQHAKSGFVLSDPHSGVECAGCHDPAARSFRQRYPARSADRCRTCHEDPHGGQFDAGHRQGGDCLDCHDRQRFDPPLFDHARHADTRMPLTDRHLEAECEACHKVPAEGRPREFQGTPVTCDGCHRDAHEGFFDRRMIGQVPGPQGRCAQCHRPTSFSDEEEGFDHARWTGFAIRGAHAQETCETCHRPDPEPDASGRTFGRIAVVHGRFEGCVTCHEDPHRGQFDGVGKPVDVGGRRGCARCHSETSFRALEERFDHGLWTGFALIGAHHAASCTDCHAPLARPDEHGRSLGRAKGRDCADCHRSPHGNQFEEAGRTRCTRCHAPRDSFGDLLFDHDVNSRFALGDRHAKVACARCHPQEKRGEESFVRYKPLPSRCIDCHPAFDDPFQRDRGRQK